MAKLDKQMEVIEERCAEEKHDKVRIQILVVVGLDIGNSVEQKICHINLDKQDTINFIFPTTTTCKIPAESTACISDNNLYLVGCGAAYNELWKWSAERDEWTRLADLPSGRIKQSATCVGEKIYVLGGWAVADIERLDSVLCYDINYNTWTQVSQLCHAVYSAACVTYKHFIYVFGGANMDDKDVNHVQVYDTSTDKVTLSSNPVPAAQRLMRAVLWGAKVILIGRWICYIFNFELNSWEERKRFKTDVDHFGLTLNDDTLYISGGGTARTDENNEIVWTCSDEVKSLSVDDFISNNQQAEWKHHNKLPRLALIHSYSAYGIEKDISSRPSLNMTYVDVELNGQMRGMTVVDERLFVVPSEDPVVNVYDAHSLKSLFTINVPDMKDPQDLAGCSHNKALYISDRGIECIHRVNIADRCISQWNVRENYRPRGLSVTSGHNVLVTLQIIYTETNMSLSESKVVECTSEGQELREITLGKSITYALKTVELDNDYFLICCSSLYLPLCVIDCEGQILRSYGGRGKNILHYPCSITIDKKRELVFVAKGHSNGIETFTTDLLHLGQMQTSHQGSGSSRIYFESFTDHLFIDSSTCLISESQRNEIIKHRMRNKQISEDAEDNRNTVRILVVVGLNKGGSVEPKICHINLVKEDTTNFIFAAPTEIRVESAACVIQNDLYLVGVGSARNELWIWSSERDEWTRLANLPSGRRRHCATCVDDKIYVLGGQEDTDCTTDRSVIRYDIRSNIWTWVTQFCQAVEGAACVTYKNCIYVFGGEDANEEVNLVQVYDTYTNKVTLSSNPMPDTHSLMRAVLRGSKALLIGRWTCYIYDFETNTWEERKRFKTDVYHFGLTLTDDTLYISGGGKDDDHMTVWTCSDEVKSLSVDDFISDNQQAEWKHHNKLPRPALVQSFNAYGIERNISWYRGNARGDIRGLTVVDDQLLVVHERHESQVNVYDSNSMKALPKINIPDMKDPQDLAGCSHNKSFYISDSEIPCIHVVSIRDEPVKKWKLRENHWSCGLSVTSDHNVLVAIRMRYIRSDSRVLEYSSDGRQIREIKLDRNIKGALKTVEYSNNMFIICPSSLYMINSEGQIVRKHNERTGKYQYQLSSIRSLAVEKKYGLVFVADQLNNRIDIFTTDLLHLGQVQTFRQLSEPSYVYVDSFSNRLFIGEKTGLLIVCQLKDILSDLENSD